VSRLTAWHRPRGQALVEFALVATLLAFLIVGGVDFARAFYFDIVASSAAMAGATAAANGDTDAEARAAAQASVGTSFPTPGVTITPAQNLRTATICTPATCVWTTVTATYTYQPITPLLGSLIGNNVSIQRSVSQRMRTNCQTAAGSPC
jgi:Flp pilus assembly protein TadG